MARVEEKIAEIADPALRQAIAEEVAHLKKHTRFGLVFEEHQPEVGPIYGRHIKRGERVARKTGHLAEIWRVVSVKDNQALCELEKSGTAQVGSRETIPVQQLVVIRSMGEPIYPALTPVDSVTHGDPSAPHHILIEADNYHALQLMLFPYEGKVDCIYIDPPYNSGSRDWKYNNDYVDKNDAWQHSKWLTFMSKRLRLAQRLLNPSESTLIVAIDDNELFTLGLLLDEIFKDCDRQIVNVTINPKGKACDGRLSQVDEYLIIVYVGSARAQEVTLERAEVEVRWPYLRRSDVESARGTKKGGVRQFYPIYVDTKTEKIICIGEPLNPTQPLTDAKDIPGAVPVFPIRDDGKHMNWGLTEPSLKRAADLGFVRVSKSTNDHQAYNFAYVTVPSVKKIENGTYRVAGLRSDGSKIVVIPGGKPQRGTTAWKKNLHDANSYGSQIVSTFIPDKKFPFPKSVYAVYDALQLFVSDKPNALVVDFFAGSGTTLNAVNLLNANDQGQRQCIMVTNNEVSEDEAAKLASSGFQPGQETWEQNGICRSVTWPRSKFSILGKDERGVPLEGNYFTGKNVSLESQRIVKQWGFAEGKHLAVAQRKQIAALLPNLAQNKVTDSPWLLDTACPVSILWDIQHGAAWLEELANAEQINEVYVATIDNRFFSQVKTQALEVMGSQLITEEEKRPLSAGFETNIEYFRLDFLDPQEIEMGRQFAAILPILWMMAGARGPRPDAPDAHAPWLLPDGCPFVVLMQETRFKDFVRHVESRTDLTHVFIVTHSQNTIDKLRHEWPGLCVVQLYKDYLENFSLNLSEKPAP